MAGNYVLLQRIELNASAASVTFSNIPQTGYTDLKVVVSARTTNNNGGRDYFALRFNGSSAAEYGWRWLYGFDASATGSASSSAQTYQKVFVTSDNQSTANTFGNAEIYIPNYLSGNFKSSSGDTVSENNSSSSWIVAMSAGLWSNTSAINSISLFAGDVSGSFAQYSTFSLYGLAAVGTTPAIAPKASGGNRIDTDGTYWYHTFTSNGTFTPQTGLSCDVLVVAGGGGGSAGGGGAGGLVYSASNSLTSTSYTVTVGAGGTGRGGDISGSQGTNSQLGALTAATGGGFGAGGSVGSVTGGNGGSGGGAGAAQGATTITASGGTGSQGFDGGSLSSASRSGGGGGGAGQVGANGTSNNGGVGGNGLNTYSSWATATSTGANSGYYAGGGGGTSTSTTTKAGGLGGGGAGGGDTVEGVPGTVNTGGGGGGSRTGTGGRDGGSGIVIVRYTIA